MNRKGAKDNQIKFGTLAKYAKAWAILLVLFTVSTTAVCMLPNKTIKENTLAGVSKFIPEFEYENPSWKSDNFSDNEVKQLDLRFYYPNETVMSRTVVDGFSDALMMSLMYYTKPLMPLYSAMIMPIHIYGEPDTYSVPEIKGFTPNASYGRYWNGWMVLFRPLWMVAGFREGLLFLLMLVLFGVVYSFIHISNKIGESTAYAFLLTLCSIGFPVVFMNYENFTSFFVMFVALLTLLFCFKDKEYTLKIPLFLFYVGACTSFFDLLTSPLITFGIPMITALLLIIKNEWMEIKAQMLLLVKSFASWIAGYGLLWVSKWLIADVFYQEGITANAISKVLERVGAEGPLNGEFIPFFEPVLKAFRTMFNGANAVFALITLSLWVMMLIYTLLKDKKFVKQQAKRYSVLLLVAIMPYLWLMLLREHTGIHYFMHPFRQQMITVFACLVFMVNTVKFPWRRMANVE